MAGLTGLFGGDRSDVMIGGWLKLQLELNGKPERKIKKKPKTHRNTQVWFYVHPVLPVSWLNTCIVQAETQNNADKPPTKPPPFVVGRQRMNDNGHDRYSTCLPYIDEMPYLLLSIIDCVCLLL